MKKQFKMSLIFVLAVFSTCIFAAEMAPTPAPDFTLKSEGGGDSGKNIKLSDYKGQVVLLNFWASWCGPCRKEMPLLEELYVQYKDLGVVLLGVNVESESEKAFEFLKKVPVTFPILLDTESTVSEMYKLEAMPTTVMIDRNGNIRSVHRGFKDGYEKLYEKDIKELAREM